MHDDVLGLRTPDDWPFAPVPVRVGTVYREHAGLRQSVELLESQPWLPASARQLAESVLMAVGRPPVKPLVEIMPGAWPIPSPWRSLCSWAYPQRCDLPGRLRMARRGMELLTGEWPWGSSWVEPLEPPPPWVVRGVGADRHLLRGCIAGQRTPRSAGIMRRSPIAHVKHARAAGAR